MIDSSSSEFEIKDSADVERMNQFVSLYTKHYSRLRYYLMAIVPGSHDAVDVLQETSLILWKKFDTFEPGSNFMAWACQIARLQAMKQGQRNRRSPRLFDEDVLELVAGDAEQAANLPEVRLEILEHCVGRLSEKDQMLIRRRYDPNSTVQMLAAEIGRTANSVSKSLGRIRRTLQNCIQKRLPSEWI